MGVRSGLKRLLPRSETGRSQPQPQPQPQSLRPPTPNTASSSLTGSISVSNTPLQNVDPNNPTTSLHDQTISPSSNATPSSSQIPPDPAANSQTCSQPVHDNNKSKLWEQAKGRIKSQDYNIIEEFVLKENGSLKFEPGEIGDLVQSLLEEGRICKEKRWTISYGTHTLNLQQAVEKTLYWLDKIKAPVEIAVSADPIHAALPWAAIKCLVLVRVPIQTNQSVYLTRTWNRFFKPKDSR